MSVEITEIDPTDAETLLAYASVPISLVVNSVLEVDDAPGGDGFVLNEVPVKEPWTKDYRDAEAEDEVVLVQRFVCEHNSAFFVATDDGLPVAGAVAIRFCPDAEYYCMTNGRDDVAVLHDLRVAPSHQRNGIGRRLFETVSDWARNEGMRCLKIETQNTNVPACRFYQRMGARLGGLERHAYAGANSDEVMLLWYLEL